MSLGLMTAISAASADIFKLFDWNRDVYMFDKSQRLEREEMRMKMQMERFDLFRQDIKDLYMLTVDRMDMYHLVGALFLHSCVVLLAEGRVEAVAPPFLLSMYLFNSACAFVYLLYAVWLAMHASIAAQSFGVRLLLRYVRLPLPTNEQIDALASTLAEYETSGVSNALRVPFVQRPKWKPTDVQQEAPVATRFGGLKLEPAPGMTPKFNRRLSQLSLPGVDTPGEALHAPPPTGPDARRGFLGKAEMPLTGEDDFMLSTSTLPGQHVELFRRLQAKWNCFDAYARVCMQIGVHHILLALSYFAVNVMMVENRSPTCCWALVILFQGAHMGICALDMSAYGAHFVAALNLMSAAPLVTTIISISFADRLPNGAFSDLNTYPLAFLCFVFQLIWLELLLHVATPDSDDGRVPKKSRTVFYMDVFGDAEEAHEPKKTDDEDEDDGDASPKTKNAVRKVRQQAELVRQSVAVIRSAIGLWESLPKQALSEGQQRELERARAQLELCHRVARDLFEWCAQRKVLSNSWTSPESSPRVNFGSALVGPLEKPTLHGPAACYMDPEIDDFIPAVPDGRQVITMMRLFSMIQELKSRTRTLREVAVEATGDKTLMANIPKTREEYNAVLPWRVLSWSSRLVQFCLAWLAFSTVLREQGLWKIDYHQKIAGERRLSVIGELPFGKLEVAWPQGLFFHPEALSCLPGASDLDGQLLLGSPFRQYGARVGQQEAGVTSEGSTGSAPSSPLRFEELSEPGFPPSAVAMCAAPEPEGTDDAAHPPRCLYGLVTDEGVNVWPAGAGPFSEEAVRLPIDGRPWRRLSGVLVRCREALEASGAEQGLASKAEEWCLLLAGWDGVGLPVAVVPLPRGPRAPPVEGSRIRPLFDVPVPPSTAPNVTEFAGLQSLEDDLALPDDDGSERVALHVEPRRGRLWVLLEDGRLQAWELLRPKSLGSWRLRWPTEKVVEFQGAALCEQGAGQLFVVGRTASSGPQLLRVRLPTDFSDGDEAPLGRWAGARRLLGAWA